MLLTLVSKGVRMLAMPGNGGTGDWGPPCTAPGVCKAQHGAAQHGAEQHGPAGRQYLLNIPGLVAGQPPTKIGDFYVAPAVQQNILRLEVAVH